MTKQRSCARSTGRIKDERNDINGMKLGWNENLEQHHATWSPCSKISERKPPLEALQCTQDKAMEEGETKTHNSLSI